MEPTDNGRHRQASSSLQHHNILDISYMCLTLFLEYFLFDISDIALLLNKLYQFVVAHSPGKGNLPYLPG